MLLLKRLNKVGLLLQFLIDYSFKCFRKCCSSIRANESRPAKPFNTRTSASTASPGSTCRRPRTRTRPRGRTKPSTFFRLRSGTELRPIRQSTVLTVVRHSSVKNCFTVYSFRQNDIITGCNWTNNESVELIAIIYFTKILVRYFYKQMN